MRKLMIIFMATVFTLFSCAALQSAGENLLADYYTVGFDNEDNPVASRYYPDSDWPIVVYTHESEEITPVEYVMFRCYTEKNFCMAVIKHTSLEKNVSACGMVQYTNEEWEKLIGEDFLDAESIYSSYVECEPTDRMIEELDNRSASL
jgi:hypothetical protein